MAKQWQACSFREFQADFKVPTIDRDAWTSLFADALDLARYDQTALERSEVAVVSSGSTFGLRLAELRRDFDHWPLVRSNLDAPGWLEALSSDPDSAAADVYFAVSRGFCVLSPEDADSFPQTATDNYRSAEENREAVDKEIARLLQFGFIGLWDEVAAEIGSSAAAPTVTLAIGAFFRKGKVRIVIDGSAPKGRSVNDAMEPPDTVLPNIAMAMAAMTVGGSAWKADFTDAFLQSALHPSSVPLCGIKWGGKVYAYRRLGFGFRSGPSHQQSVTLAVVRALTRRLQTAGLSTAVPPTLDHVYPHLKAVPPCLDRVNALLAFLDDVGGFCSSIDAAWFSFAHYLLLCRDLSLAVAFKPGKTDDPRSVLHYLGFNCHSSAGYISLDDNRLEELRQKMAAISLADSVSVRDILSLAGVLIFCSVVIPLGRTHYRSLFEAVTALGPRPSMRDHVVISPAIRDSIEMWSQLLSLLNGRSAMAPILRATVPG